jgi:hypothetical protein
LPHNIEYQLFDVVREDNGRFLILDIEIFKVRMILVNVYMPTRDHESEQIALLESLQDSLNFFSCDCLIIGGDFNLYLDPNLDRHPGMKNTNDNKQFRTNLRSFLESYELVDIWRVLNPELRRYTWHRGKQASRLDYIFTSEYLSNTCDPKKTDIGVGLLSDHSLVSVSFTNNESSTRGRGFWKFNASLLYDKEYVQMIKEVIKQNAQCLDNLPDKGLKWEMIKLKIRSATIPYSCKKKKEINKLETDLNNRLSELQLLIDSQSASELEQEEFYHTKNDLEQIEKHKAAGIILRSKATWVEDGEKCTAFFLSLEKKNYSNKLISQLQVGNEIISEPKSILVEENKFFTHLYKEVEHKNFEQECLKFTNNEAIPKITESQKQFCDSEITEEELTKCIKFFKNKKSPGTDGLPAEFYKFFWNDIKQLVLESFKYALRNGELSVEQKRGIISLIPKKDKNRLYLKNWRPISLLNVDYKLLAKVFASRLETVLPFIVSDDQTGYIKGRYIGCNVRVTEDLIYYTNKHKLPGILLMIDFEKAFDTIRWQFIDRTLEAFNFGILFRSWIQTLYSNIETTIVNNGNISEWFCPERGVRQGCPLSAFLFILTVELLAINIRSNKDIEGIKINGSEFKISQLADDTTCTVTNVKSVGNIFVTFYSFKECAGLSANKEKTKAKYIGSLVGLNHHPFGLCWTEDSMDSLGVIYVENENDNYFQPRIKKLKDLLKLWKWRSLSLKGKITIINSLAISSLVYIASVTNVPSRVIHEVNDILYDFLWDGGSSKVAKAVINQKIAKGGLKMVDFEAKVKSLKMSWIKRILSENSGKWTNIIKHFYNEHNLNQVFNSRLTQPPTGLPIFYHNMHSYWLEINNSEPNTPKQIVNELIWNNKFITINRKPYLWQQWRSSGILYIGDLLDKNNLFLSFSDIERKFGLKCNFLSVLQLRQSIPFSWRQKLIGICGEFKAVEGCRISLNKDIISIHNLSCKQFYWMYIEKYQRQPTCIATWNERYNMDNDVWEAIFEIPFTCTRDTKLQSFQFRLNHRIIQCNKWLNKLRIKDSSKCNYCEEEDTLIHFFLNCEQVDSFWHSFFVWFKNASETSIDFSILHEQLILFGYKDHGDFCLVLNFCLLLARYYIYIQRVHGKNNLDICAFLIMLKNKLTIEKLICENEDRPEQFHKWNIIFDNL